MFYSGGKKTLGDGCLCNINLSEQHVRAMRLEILTGHPQVIQIFSPLGSDVGGTAEQ